jgi:hypothetical protein
MNFGNGVLVKLIPFVVSKSNHEWDQLLSVRTLWGINPEPVEGQNYVLI